MGKGSSERLKPAPAGTPQARFGELLGHCIETGRRPAGKQWHGRWTRETFAVAIGVGSRNTVRHYCIGATQPKGVIWEKIVANLFGDGSSEQKDEFIRAYKEAVGVVATSPPVQGVGRPPAFFPGRAADIAVVRDALLAGEEPVAVLVHGVGGIGKTALTRALAHDPAVVERFGERRRFVALETALTTAQMSDAIVTSLGCERVDGLAKALARVAGDNLLLILDNLETPWESTSERQATEELLAQLGATPGLTILTSFRGTEMITGPRWTLIHSLQKLDRAPATDLFCYLANWKNRDDPVLQDFITALDGLPLALELVARRAFGEPNLSPLWRRWNEIGIEFAVRLGQAPNHLTSLPQSIRLSLESPRVTPDALRLFKFLGGLPAGLADGDQRQLIGPGAFDASETLRRTDLALGDATRIDLLSPIRQFAAKAYTPTQADELAWINHFLDLVRTCGEPIGTNEGEGAVGRLLPEFPNIEAAFFGSLRQNRRSTALSALPGHARFTYIAALPSTSLLELARSCHLANETEGEANCLRALGNIAAVRFDHEAARDAYEKALPLYKTAGDLHGEADCVYGLGEIAYRLFDYVAALEAYVEALPLYKSADVVLGQANCISRLGEIASASSDPETAREAYEEALPLYRDAGSVHGEAQCILGIAEIARERSDNETALKAYEQALPLFRKAGSLHGEANCVLGPGEIARASSDFETAQDCYERAILIYKKASSPHGEAYCLEGLAEITLARREYAVAREAYGSALVLYRKVNDAAGENNCLVGLDEILQATIDPEVI